MTMIENIVYYHELHAENVGWEDGSFIQDDRNVILKKKAAEKRAAKLAAEQ